MNTLTAPPHRTLDLQTERCPKTFLYSKLAFEELGEGESLQITFGDPDSFSNVRKAFGEISEAQIENDESRPLTLKISRKPV